MPFSLQDDDEKSDSEAKNQTQKAGFIQQRKQDALNLALLAYDLYKESQSDDRMMENNRSDDD